MDVQPFACKARRPSASVQPHEPVRGLSRRSLAFLLANAMFWQPLWAQAAGITVSGPGTTLGQAGNGVPIVNIAAPNGSGLSHNQFNDYNVGREGVILNNATNRTQSTQLGGIILGNSNLQGRGASTILNEVTGGNASRLQGYTEVAGQSARVIVANPHGITCDGCGFINTPRATLTTGKPVLDNGKVTGYQVDGGSIAIEGQGLNASNIDSFELITRSTQINARLHAKKLDIVTGRNDVDAETLQATARASDGSQAPALAIDSSALGGMYAGSIRLVGTEAGVGVKLAGDMAATAGDLNIDANGKVTLANASASTDLQIKAAQVELAGTTYAGGNASVRSTGDVDVHKSLAARERLTVDAQQVRNAGVIEAGVEADNTRNQTGDVVLTSTGLANSGQLVASRELKATVVGTLDNTGGALKGQQLVVDADTLLNQGGQVLADQHLQADTRVLDNRSGGALSSAGTAKVTARERLDNQGGRVVGVDQLTVAGGQANNSTDGLMASDGVVDITVAGLDNQGGKVSASDLQVKADSISNQGGSLVGKTVQASAGQLHNNGGSIVATEGTATVTGHQLLDNSAGTLQAGTHLQANGGELRNVNGAMLGASAGITADSLDNSQNGRVVADQGALGATISGALNNNGGRLQATEGTVDVSAGSIANQGGLVVAQQHVKLSGNSGSLDNRGGQVLGSGVELEGASVDNSGGKVLAGNGGLKVTAASLLNRQGTLLVGGATAELLLGGGRLDNQQGSISASSVTLVADDADNSGGTVTSLSGNLQLTVQRLTNRNGLLEASQAVVLSGQSLDNSQNGRLIAHRGDAATLSLTGQLDNQGGRIASATGDMSIRAGSLLNQGGSIEHAGAGKLQLTAGTFNGSQGSVRGLGSGQFTLGTVDGVGTWHVNGNFDITGLQSIALNAGERIASAANLSLGGGSLNNAGELLSDGTLTLNMNGALSNQGLVSSLQGMHIEGASLTQSGGRIASGGPMLLQLAGALTNQGRLTSSNTLQVSAGSIVNQGTLGAQGNVTLRAGSIENQDGSLTFAGGALALRSASLLNRYADLYSKGDLSFAGLDEGRAQSLQNLSGSIESEGNIDLKVNSLENAKAVFVPGKAIADRYIRINCTDCSGDHHTGFYIVTTTYKGTVESDSPAARLLANRDLTLDTITVDNRQSLLAANGNLTATAVNFYNRGLTLDNQIEEVSYWLHGVTQSAYRVTEAATNQWNAANRNLPPDQQAPIPTAVTRYPVSSTNTRILPGTDTAYAGTVQAGGTVALNVSGELVNGTLDPHSNAQLTGQALDAAAIGAGGVQVTLGTQAGDPGLPQDVKRIETTAADGSTQVSFVPVDFSGAPFVNVDPTALPSFHLPQGEYGLFVRNQNPTSSYLIETNPELTNLGRFMASDYLLGQIGFDADQAWRRLGDGRYETRLVADAVLAQTGQRFLADGLTSDYEQFKYLMDNAVASKDALGLSVGVGLTSQQVAALTHDIVWMEERVVDGQAVLAPVLYLAKVDSRNLRGGSLIQGRDLQLVTGGDLKNVGTLRASEDLTALAGGSLYQGGLMQANEHLTVMAQDSIRNALAGEIRGNQVDLVTVKGDIVNDRTATQVAVGAGSATRVDAGSLISARSGMTLDAGGDLTNKGSLTSGGDLTARAAGDINLLAVEDRTVTQDALRRGLRTEETVTQLGSSVQAAGNLTMQAGNDLNVIASQASAGKDLEATAKNDINLIAGEDSHDVESRYKQGKKKVHEVDEHSSMVAASLSAGGNLGVAAGNDVTLVASEMHAGEEAYVYAGNDLTLLAGQERDYTLYDMKKKGSWGSKQSQRDEVTDITHVGSQITSGGNMTLASGNDQVYQVANLESGGNLTLDSGGDILFVGAKDLHQESHEKSKSNAGWFSMKGKGSTDETLRQSQLQAEGDLVIKAVGNIQVDVRQVNQQSVSQTIDAMVKADPKLQWIKDLEAQGGIDWRQVEEIHTSFKYANSGLGPAAQLAIAIMMAAVMGPAGFGLTGVQLAGAASLATTGAVSTINNKGDLGAALKETLSKESLKSAATSMVVAGAISYVDDSLFSSAEGAQSTGQLADKAGTVASNSPSNVITWDNATQTLTRAGTHAVVSSGVSTAINGGSFSDNLTTALAGQAGSIAAATGFDWVGGNVQFDDGSLPKILAHAMMGGLVAEATGSDFATGAAAAGLNEAAINALAEIAQGNPQIQLALSQLVGVVAAAAVDGDLEAGSQIAWNSTQYNYLTHHKMQEVDACLTGKTCSTQEEKQRAVKDAEALSKMLDDEMNSVCSKDPGSQACVGMVRYAMQYTAMQDAWESAMNADVQRSATNVFDRLYNTEDAAGWFASYLNNIDARADFFGASDRYERYAGLGAKWFGGAEEVSRAMFTGLGADGKGSMYTFMLGRALAPVYDWRAAAGDTLVNAGFDNFKALFNRQVSDAVAWDVNQLRNEQRVLQPVHEQFLKDRHRFVGLSQYVTDTDYTPDGILDRRGMPGGVNILDYESRVKYGCKLLGYGSQVCTP